MDIQLFDSLKYGQADVQLNMLGLQNYHRKGFTGKGVKIALFDGGFYKVDSIWIPTIANSLIHTIMYSYYLGCLLKINSVRFIKQYITSLQLIQLIIPNFICLYFYKPPIESEFNYNLIKLFVSYVSVLVVLFCRFYYINYIGKNKQI